MKHAIDAGLREELRSIRPPDRGKLARLLVLLREAPDTHLRLVDVERIAEGGGLSTTATELARQMDTLVDHGSLARLPTTAAEPVFDTVPEPHAHLIYENPSQIVDLAVSPTTLFAILARAFVDHPAHVEVLIRFRPLRRRGSIATSGPPPSTSSLGRKPHDP